MNVLKIITRVVLVPLILVFGYQTILATFGFISVLPSAATNTYALGERLGSLTVPLLLLIVSVWGFRRLGAKPPASKA